MILSLVDSSCIDKIRESENNVATRKKKKSQTRQRERQRAMKKTDASEMATEFLLSQTRDMLDNALKKSIHEREVLLSTRKVTTKTPYISIKTIV